MTIVQDLVTGGALIEYRGYRENRSRTASARLPPAHELIGVRGYDSGWFRTALIARGIAPCILSTRSRKAALPMTKPSTASVTASRTPLAVSKTRAYRSYRQLLASVVSQTLKTLNRFTLTHYSFFGLLNDAPSTG